MGIGWGSVEKKKKKKRDMVDRRYLTFFSFQIRLINENWNRIPMFPSIER